MRRSKLEAYEAILEALVNKPLSVENVAYETDMECTGLVERLDYLLENGLVELRPIGKTGGYAITDRGVAVLKALNFQKYLARVANKLSMIDEALQVISKHKQDLENDPES
jgi:predicted transcriptional regulator